MIVCICQEKSGFMFVCVGLFGHKVPPELEKLNFEVLLTSGHLENDLKSISSQQIYSPTSPSCEFACESAKKYAAAK